MRTHTFIPIAFWAFFILSSLEGNAQVPTYVPASGLIAWYPFSGNSGDSSGHGYNGTDFGATLTIDRFGNANKAYNFNGGTSYIQLPMKQSAISSWSISAWFKTDSGGVILQGGNYGSGIDAGITMNIYYPSTTPPFNNKLEIRADGAGYSVGLATSNNLTDNNWHHVVGIWNSTSGTLIDSPQFSIYIDGALISSYNFDNSVGHGGTCGPQPAPLSPSGNMVIGAHPYGWGQYFYGSLDDIGLWNRALTPCEVYQLYHASTAFAGTITGSSTLAIGYPLTLTDTTSGGIWSASNTTIATVGSTGIVTGLTAGIDTIKYTVTNVCGTAIATKVITVNLPTISAPCYVPSSGLIAWYPFTGNTIDSSGNGNNGINHGATLTTDRFGNPNSAYAFNGINNYIEVPYNATLNLPDSLTLSAWINTTNTSISEVIMDKSTDGTSNGWLFDLSPNPINDHMVRCLVGGVTTGLPYSNPAITLTNTWYFVTATFDKTNVKFYINGVFANAVPVTSSTPATTNPIKIGTFNALTYGFWGGKLDDIGIWNRPLSACEISKLYQASCASVSAGTITGSSSICSGSSFTLTDTASGGIWSSSNAGIATVGSTGLVTGVAVGTATISYTKTNVCGSAYTVMTITVNPLPTAGTISGSSSVCIGASTTLTDGITGGLWGATNGNAIISSGGVVYGLIAGVDTINYIVTNTCGTAIATKIITVNPLPISGTISGSSSVCAGSTITLSNTVTGGTWSSSNTGIATIGSTGIVTGIVTGVDTVKYIVTNGCGTAIAVKIITVNPLPAAGTISGSSSVCVGASTTLTDVITSGLWSAANGNAIVSSGGVVYGLIAGIDTVMYSFTNSCGTAIATKTITINPLPYAGAISGSSSVCAGSTITLSNTVTGGAWSSSNIGIATIGSTGVVTGLTAGTDTIIYTFTNTCGIAIVSKIITVNPLPTAGTISGSSSVCIGASTTLTDGITGGVWGATNGNAIISSSGVVHGLIAGIDTVIYTVTNSCGSVSTTRNITVNPLPNAGTISGSSSVCAGSTITLSNTVTGGAWSISNANATISGSIVTGMTAGIDTMIYTVTNSCGTATTNKIVSIDPLPTAGTITGADTVCMTEFITVVDTTTGGVWSSMVGTASVSSTGLVTGVNPGADTILYTVTNSCGSAVAKLPVVVLQSGMCSSGIRNLPEQSQDITLYPNPTQNNITLSSLLPINTVIVSNLLGQKVFTGVYNDNKVVINLGQLPEGIYLLKINNAYVYKVIKQ